MIRDVIHPLNAMLFGPGVYEIVPEMSLTWVKPQVLFETLQEEILGPCDTDLQACTNQAYVPTSNKYEVLAVDKTNEQDSQGETAPAAHTKSCKRKWRVLVVGDC